MDKVLLLPRDYSLAGKPRLKQLSKMQPILSPVLVLLKYASWAKHNMVDCHTRQMEG